MTDHNIDCRFPSSCSLLWMLSALRTDPRTPRLPAWFLSSSSSLCRCIILPCHLSCVRMSLSCHFLSSIQVFRRLYECVFVNQPSSSTMNITHYIVGYAHYFCAATGYICEAPSFAASGLNLASLGLDCWALVAVFFAAWYYEFEAHKIFADLKKTRPGTHSIPTGSLFEVVSCPHYLCEVLIYTCFTLLLTPAHQTGLLVWVWVTTNQMIAATMSHNWYKRKFKEYPPNRKAIIPFLL